MPNVIQARFRALAGWLWFKYMPHIVVPQEILLPPIVVPYCSYPGCLAGYGWLWLAGCLADWLRLAVACWLTGWLAGRQAGRLADWLAGWLAAGWLAGWLAGLGGAQKGPKWDQAGSDQKVMDLS